MTRCERLDGAGRGPELEQIHALPGGPSADSQFVMTGPKPMLPNACGQNGRIPGVIVTAVRAAGATVAVVLARYLPCA